LNGKNGALTVVPSIFETGAGETYAIQGVVNSVFLTKPQAKLKTPLYCPTLFSNGNLKALPDFANFDPELLTLSYFTS
jgi:hypothetical protein